MEAQTKNVESVAEIVRTIMPANAGRTAIRVDDGQKYLSVGYREYLENVRIMANFFVARAGNAQQVVATFGGQ